MPTSAAASIAINVANTVAQAIGKRLNIDVRFTLEDRPYTHSPQTSGLRLSVKIPPSSDSSSIRQRGDQLGNGSRHLFPPQEKEVSDGTDRGGGKAETAEVPLLIEGRQAGRVRVAALLLADG